LRFVQNARCHLFTSQHALTCDTQAPGRLFIVLEFCAGGDLAAWLSSRPGRRAGEASASHFLRHLARGLAELRRLHVVHRDLKPHNLLLVPAPDDGRERERCPATGAPLPLLKIADLGFATRLPGGELAETLCGSPLYMARPRALYCRLLSHACDLR
jgi:serine/threonine-protein kinase ULK/ATG1